MSLFDFFFPEQAQATHLRKLSDTISLHNVQSRINSSRSQEIQMSMKKRIDELESEVGQLTIVIEALLECIADRNILTREELARKIGEIDARDAVLDGRITKQKPQLEEPKSLPKFNFPD